MPWTAKRTWLSLLVLTAPAADGAELTGYLMDRLCVTNCLAVDDGGGCAPDGSNAFFTPQRHTGNCKNKNVSERSDLRHVSTASLTQLR